MRLTATALAAGAALLGAAGLSAKDIAPPVSNGALVLTGGGFSAAGKTATFDVTSRVQAVALASGSLGRPVEQGSHGDCGQSAIIDYAKFRGGFELSFVKGKLSGWTADGAGPRTSRGIGVGVTLATLRKAYPDIETDPGDEANGGLGPSFQREGGPDGWLDGVKPMSKITGLFAGATCLAGV